MQRALHVVGDVDGGAAAPSAGVLRPQRVEECHGVARPRVHEEEVGVHALPAAHRGAVEHVLRGVDGDGHDAVGELGEERGEAEQEGLAAGGALGADDEVAALEQGLDAGGVGGAVAGEGDGGDRGEGGGEAADAVGDAGDGAAESDGDDDGVEGGAVVADEEGAREDGEGTGEGAAADGEADAGEAVGVADERGGDGEVEEDAEEGEDEAEGR
uniref:Uncharacterized protein n=1 Tax=Ananas comosus var. bracteatus TaxID=296719 RepID=A0A6V7QCF6_ANACO|nr:unnamed protein product [Ananas comosus var. bracteatus]